MTEQSIAKKGIILNTVLIIATIVAFIVIKITNSYLTSNFGYSGYYMEMFTLQKATLIGLLIVSVVVTICSAVLMTKNQERTLDSYCSSSELLSRAYSLYSDLC